MQPTPVKVAALARGIPTLEPLKMRDSFAPIAAARADLFAVASYGKILPQALLDLAARGALNVHPSLLPLYRGATPLQTQLRDGVSESGVTVIFMDAGMDTGDIVLVERSAIGPDETYGELHDRFARLGGKLLGQAVRLVAEGNAERTPQAGLASQEDIERTMTHPLDRRASVVDWSWPARRIVDHVRSLSPSPGARATLGGEEPLVKLLDVRVADGPDFGELVVPCGSGEFVAIERLVPPNRNAMTGRAYLASAVTR